MTANEIEQYEQHKRDQKIFALENPEPMCTSCISINNDKTYPPCNHCYPNLSGVPSNYENYKKARERCGHYWIQGLKSPMEYRCVFCHISQNVDPKTMHIDNGNHERF